MEVMIELLETGEIKLAPFEYAVFDDHSSLDFWVDGFGYGFAHDTYHYILAGFVLYFLSEEVCYRRLCESCPPMQGLIPGGVAGDGTQERRFPGTFQ